MSGKLRPKMFIGSSSAALPVVELFVAALSQHVSCVPWNLASQFNCEGTNTTVSALQSASLKYDFALFVLTPDDTVTLKIDGKRRTLLAFRDNVIFEIGLFLGSIGARRVFIARQNSNRQQRIPSDLLGAAIQAFAFDIDDRDRSLASVNAAVSGFKVAIEKQSFLEFRLQLASGWGWEYKPQRFEVDLDGALLKQQQHLLDGYDIAIAARIEVPTVNLEDDPGIAFSEIRAIPQDLSSLTFVIKAAEFSKRPKIGEERIQGRLLLVPPKTKLKQFRTLKEAQAEGCRVVETMSCRVVAQRK